MKHKNIYVALVILVVLSLPYLLSAPWTLFDYIIGALFLFGVWFLFDLVTTKLTSQKKKMIGGTCILVVSLYIWGEFAVGIFTTLGS